MMRTLILSNLLCLITFNQVYSKVVHHETQLTHPPRFLEQPEAEVAYKEEDGVRVELKCVAEADPPATYFWKKDGEELNILEFGYERAVGTGTLYISSPTLDHEGVYQCFASNSFGTALSTKSLVRKAVLHSFPTNTNVPVKNAVIGDSLILPCDSPLSYPKGEIYWGPNSAYERIQLDNRVTMDYNGKLYFSNIVASDDLDGTPYACMIGNNVIRSVAKGDDAEVRTLQPPTETIQFRVPKLLWKSQSPTVALFGSKKSMKCIYSGYPTPNIRWVMLDSRNREIALPSRVTGGQTAEITFQNVNYDDKGKYRCIASNNYGEDVFEDLQLEVESLPQWIHAPASINSAVEENVSFHCNVRGKPIPEITWSINGEPFVETHNRRLATNGTTVIYESLEESNVEVLQCNASNKHGYIFANAFLNVAADPPTFLEVPDPSTVVAEHQSINITCRAYGAPTPKITWYKIENGGDDILLEGGKYTVQPDGYLTIQGLTHDDEGTYKCNATNKFGSKKATGSVYVRDATRITQGPRSATVRVNTTVTFECSATTDPSEVSKLTIKWLRNGKPLEYLEETHLHKNLQDNSLQIRVRVNDTGKYTCVANNTLDSVEEHANLIVQDRPEPPIYVRFRGSGQRFADLVWNAGPDNNSPIREYIPYYRTDFDEEGKYTECDPVPYTDPMGGGPPVGSAQIPLSPWGNFTFHIRARNDIGISDPTPDTSPRLTDEEAPYENPEGICTELGDPTKLIVVWEHMPQIKHNGEGFYYMIHYRRNKPGFSEQQVKVSDWRAERQEISVDNPAPYEQYSIYIRTGNNRGQSDEQFVYKVLGYTGEDTPLEAPQNFDVDETTINATSATFVWDRVDEGPESIRGHFKGYKIQFWRPSNPEDVREHDVILGDEFTCVEDPNYRRRRRSINLLQRGARSLSKRAAGTPMDAHISNIWPDSDIEAGILAMNSGKSGSLSPTITFRTPEGPPGIPGSFMVSETGSHHLIVSWTPPIEPNGKLISYKISYHPVSSPQSISYIADIPPSKLSQKIRDLTELTAYRVTLWASTSAGEGIPYFIEQSTLETGVPDIPGFTDFIYGDNHLNVTFEPTAKGPKENPGSHFVVEYRPKGSDGPWEEAEPEGDNNWVNITNMVPGEMYELRVVAMNGAGDRSESPVERVIFGPKQGERKHNVASAGWFIGMMIAIAFLLLILIIVCLIKKNRGGKYPVHEKEKLRGKPDNDDDEAGFGEYNKTPYTPLTSDDPYFPNGKRPGGSIDSAKKPLGGSLDGSESDSMREYEDMDPGKFNEDGSFIGQYSGKNKEPNALQTFV